MFDSSWSKIRVETRWRNRKQSTKIQSNHLLPRKTFRGRFTQRKPFTKERKSRKLKLLTIFKCFHFRGRSGRDKYSHSNNQASISKEVATIASEEGGIKVETTNVSRNLRKRAWNSIAAQTQQRKMTIDERYLKTRVWNIITARIKQLKNDRRTLLKSNTLFEPKPSIIRYLLQLDHPLNATASVGSQIKSGENLADHSQDFLVLPLPSNAVALVDIQRLPSSSNTIASVEIQRSLKSKISIERCCFGWIHLPYARIPYDILKTIYHICN